MRPEASSIESTWQTLATAKGKVSGHVGVFTHHSYILNPTRKRGVERPRLCLNRRGRARRRKDLVRLFLNRIYAPFYSCQCIFGALRYFWKKRCAFPEDLTSL